MEKITVEVNAAFIEADTTFGVGNGNGLVAITPPIDDDYWLFRVAVSEKQAIVGFPKFWTIGIGFQHEDDWNTNLPYSCEAEEIYNHIAHNKGDDTISEATCLTAIRAIQQAATLYMQK